MSYADMITILMAFFVVMYSMAGTRDETKQEAVMQSLRDQFGPMVPGAASLGHGVLIDRDSPLARMLSAGQQRKGNKGKHDAGSEIPAGERPKVQTLKPGEQAVVGAIVSFGEGSSEVGPAQRKKLQAAADEFGGKPQKIEIRGHTSSRPVPKGSSYRDNWDLAYGRCRSTMQALVEMGIDRNRLRLGVAADNEPPSGGDNTSQASLARVEVFMLDEVATASAAAPAADGQHHGTNASPTTSTKTSTKTSSTPTSK